jgi:hypothetical protein
MRTAKQQDELDFLFNLKYGNNFNQGFKSSTDQDDICQALWAHHKDIDINYIGPREPYIDSKDWTEIVHIDETINGKVLTGWSYESHNENSNIKKIDFNFWQSCSNPADTIWIISQFTLPNDEYCYYGPSFHFWNRAEADRYLKFVKKLFKTGFTTKKIKSESLMSWGT